MDKAEFRRVCTGNKYLNKAKGSNLKSTSKTIFFLSKTEKKHLQFKSRLDIFKLKLLGGLGFIILKMEALRNRSLALEVKEGESVFFNASKITNKIYYGLEN